MSTGDLATPVASSRGNQGEAQSSTSLAPAALEVRETKDEAGLTSGQLGHRSAPTESVHNRLQRLMAEASLVVTQHGWDKKYKDLPDEDIQNEVDKLENLIYDATHEEFEYRFSIGLGVEVLSTDPNYKYDAKDYDPTAVYWVRFTSGGPTEKLTLPKEEFPEIYEIKALSAYLRDQLAQK
jgi:hypothetical protein